MSWSRRLSLALSLVTSLSNSAIAAAGFAPVLVLFAVSTSAHAQATSGDLAGTVKDATGAVIAGAEVVATNEDTGVAATVRAGSSGDFHIVNLLPGKYDIVVNSTGFQPFTLHGVPVELNKTSTSDISLKVGASTTVEVQADAGAVLDTTSTNLTTTFTSAEVSELPSASIGGASSLGVQSGVLNLSLLSPGVTSSGGLGIGVGPSIGGQRPRNNNFEIEGIDNNNKALTGPLVYVANDAVGGFTLITNQFSPDFGHSSGGQFNTTVISGTNTVHGKLYEYFQNRNLNAASGIAGGKVPNAKYDNNRYGGQIGGPIFKNKLFFFANFERNTLGQNAAGNVCVPTAAGVATLNSVAGVYGFSANNLQQFIAATPLPNYLGGAQVDADNDLACGNEKTGLQYFTVTNNQTGAAAASTNIPLGNYQLNAAAPLLYHSLTTSGDYTISGKDSLRLRYIHDWETQTDTGTASGQTLLPSFFIPDSFTWHLIALSEYHSFTANLTNEFRIGYNRYANPLGEGNFTYPGLDQYPQFQFYDLGNLGLGTDQDAPQFTIQNLYQVQDNISYVTGKHTFRIGFDGRKYISPQGFTQRARGDYEYALTDQFLHDLAPDENGFAERSSGSHTYYGDQTALYGYGNDTWRATPTVTLNVGLRYEFTSVPVGERAQQLNSAASVPGLVSFNAPKPTYTALAPRVGINWAPDAKTVVRAGFGVAYDVLFDNLGTLSFPPQYSVTEDVGVAGYPGYLAPNFLKNGGLPPASGPAVTTYPTVAAQRAATSAYLPNQILPYAETYTLTVQRIFANAYTAEIGYVGTRGIHLPTQDQINIQPAVTPANQLPTYDGTTVLEGAGPNATTLAALQGLSNLVPAWGNAGFTSKITSYQPYSESNYNALIANLTRRFQRGLQLNLSYTWSKTMDDATDEVFATVLTPRRPQNSQCVACDYSRSALDRTHRLTLEAVYDLQAYKHSSNFLLKNVLGNWLVAPIYTYESPEYATVLSGDNANLNGDNGAAIDRTIINKHGVPGTGTTSSPIMNGTDVVGYTADDPNAYYVQAGPGTLPNSARNSLPIRPIDNLDVGLYKRLTFLERYSLEFGIQSWNVLNHAQYQPGTIDNVNGPSYTNSYAFQTVGSAFFNHPEKQFGNNPRNMQLSGKIIF